MYRTVRDLEGFTMFVLVNYCISLGCKLKNKQSKQHTD